VSLVAYLQRGVVEAPAGVLLNAADDEIGKKKFDLWHTADGIGEIGAATVPAVLAVAETAIRKKLCSWEKNSLSFW
jgi:hypothetical protein